MTFSETFRNHPAFEEREGLFFQRNFSPPPVVDHYLALRTHEGRRMPDDIVAQLPAMPTGHPHAEEWSVRRRSAEALMRALAKKKVRSIMEIGCGNGWLTNYLCQGLAADCCGVDINESELEQAVRIYSRDSNPSFICGDIFSAAFDDSKADVIVLAGVIQYFPDLGALLDKLINRLNPGGEIHVIDSPVYPEQDVDLAKQRSQEYFGLAGHASMEAYYHHHTWRSFQRRGYAVLHDPASFIGKIKRMFAHASPFPWVMVPGRDWE